MSLSALPLLPLGAVILFGNALDIALLLLFSIYQNWNDVQAFVNLYLNPAIVIDVAKAATALFVFSQLVRYILGLRRPSSPSDEFPLKPMFFPCRTSHVRMFPTKHGFGYSYLLTGVPVGWKGSVGGMISGADTKDKTPWYSRVFSLEPGGPWYTINGDDYLERGHVDGGLKGKLQQYLEGQGIDPTQYPHAYLVTAARFLGYASNPLSIWYLYSSSQELSALILEVNNTFDERRIYFLKPDQSRNLEEAFSRPRYTRTWQKDFYVSVFNARAGSYSLAAYDPFFPHLTSSGRIDSTVTLSSPEGKAKLIARIYSTDSAVDPLTMTLWQKICFLASWWWVGLATFPRTIQQALIILFRRKLPWVFRPEPRGTTIARHASLTEVFVEKIFCRYLLELVTNYPGPLRVRYIPAGIHDISEEVILSSSAQLSSMDEIQDLELRVLTPIFYSRLVRYPCLFDGLLCEHESATISISNSDLLSTFDLTNSMSGVQHGHSLSEMLSYKFMHLLRQRPASIVCLDEPKVPPLPTYTNRVVDSKKAQALTGLDVFVIGHSGEKEGKEYRARLWKLILIETLALGWEEILEFETFVVKSVVLWFVARIVFS